MGSDNRAGGRARRQAVPARVVGLLCALFSFLYGCVVAAMSVPELKYNRAFGGSNVGLAVVLLLCSFVGMYGFVKLSRNALSFFFLTEVLLGVILVSLTYSAGSQVRIPPPPLPPPLAPLPSSSSCGPAPRRAALG